MTHNQQVDFNKVEVLRRHMLLTTSDMAKVLGVSRMTYYLWVRGKPMRSTSVPKVKLILKKLLNILTETGWPTAEVLEMDQKQRVQRLLELLGQEQ
jgi:DNA-binding XRE family transcriptional regulator